MQSGPARFWLRLGITYKFGAAFVLLLGMVMLVAVVNLAVLDMLGKAEADIQTGMEIRQKVFEMDGGMEKARRLYRDFLLNYPQIGFEEAQELYGRPALAATARIIAVNEELKRLLGSASVDEALRKRNMDVTLYLSLAKRFSAIFLENVTLLNKLTDPEDGLETRLTNVMAALKTELADYPDLSFTLQEADLYEKQYRITRQRPYMQSDFNLLAKLNRLASQDARVSEATKKRIQEQLAEYTSIADKILDTDVSIRGNINDFALQAKTVDPIAQELKTLATEEVARFQKRIDMVGRWATVIMLATAVAGLGCSLGVAYVINASITRKIVDMTESASQLRSGNLDVHVETGSADELGVLADAFNAMTHRVKDLVENLEDKVRQRTQELAITNKELDVKNHALETLSRTDRLTGLCNRRKLDETLWSELRRVKRYHKPFSVIMVDVDNFKGVNDTFGHQAGDDALVRIADTLSTHARDTDTVGRWGGEEFLVICPETEPDVARRLAERLRREISAMTFATARKITASFGVASYDHSDHEISLIQRADEALYKAKRSGKDRVEVS